ncbi:MAG: hypothetical protein EBS05_23565 [Proteobacteria bacterium]|nr:hypothetical protein [Pseudomonadota bacterium]
MLFLAPSGAAAFYGIQAILLQIEWTTVLLTLIASVLFFWFLRNAFAEFREVQNARIVPYFQQRGGKGEAFTTGLALSRNCEQLDKLAVELSLEPLSHFGFADDISSEAVQWHSASAGLYSVRGLLHYLQAESGLVSDAEHIIADLEKIEVALQGAEAREVRFCLILRQGFDRMISPVEMDRRQGSFW